jgi:hypothetical protein
MKIQTAGFSLEELKAQIGKAGGLAQAHQFVVHLPQLKSFPMDAKELHLFCTVAAVPGRQIMSIDHMIGTTNRKFANGYATTDMTMTFLVANNHKVRQYFEAWQNEAHDQVSRTVGYFDDYTYNVKVHLIERGLRLAVMKKQLGFTNKIPSFIRNRLPQIGPIDLSQGEIDAGASYKAQTTFSCNLRECYPTSIVDQQLGNGEEGVMELSVQLSYTDWESEVGDFISEGEDIGRGVISGVFGKLFN